ncbi:hypothetical protein FOA52_014427 [Chlamydomonas sp. UWO 241]|nr:hypothetical protein FOA52_014427 [Chlamydomonas sp. UWO 241]
MTVLWMYRTCDCEELPTLELVRAPCRAERLGKDGSGRQKVPDSGELKEVFFSSHDTTITNNTVQHEVKVLFLKSCKTRVDAEAYQAMPGFLCRYIVDTTAWKYYALDPRLMESAEDAELLQLLLAKTAAELPARAAAS